MTCGVVDPTYARSGLLPTTFTGRRTSISRSNCGSIMKIGVGYLSAATMLKCFLCPRLFVAKCLCRFTTFVFVVTPSAYSMFRLPWCFRTIPEFIRTAMMAKSG